MLNDNDHQDNVLLERNLRGWLGWLDDPDPDVRQFAARQATLTIRRYGLTWGEVAAILTRAIVVRRGRRAA